MNTFKTTILLTGLTLILVLAGEYLGGTNGALIAFAIAATTNFFSYFYSDKLALSMYRAQPVTREELPRVYDVVERLTSKAGIPMPKIYVIPTESPNAFATGRNPQHASTLAGAITILARMAFWFGAMAGFGGGDRRDREGGGLGAIFMLLLAPIAAMLIQLWVSRTREYEADASGAHLTGNPYALASALEKISGASRRVPLLASPNSAHMFIIAPLLSGQTFASLFSTHPPVEKRIERLIGKQSAQALIR
jgi:heat shock protein HtpX